MESSKSLLARHMSKLKAPATNPDALVFWGTKKDAPFLPKLKRCVGVATAYGRLDTIETVMQVALYCEKKGATRVVSTSIPLLKKLLHWDKRAAPSLDSYQGSYFVIPGVKEKSPEIEVVFIRPLEALVTVPYGSFLAARHISKLTEKDTWFVSPEFTGFTLLDASNERENFNLLCKKNCFMVAIDIETFRDNAAIRCISYTGFFWGKDCKVSSLSTVLPLDSEYNLAIMRKWNWDIKAPKVFQNGKYDIAYLARYSAPVYNYLFDTAHLFHSYYSELPKDLGFLNAFFIRKAVYWKDLAKTNDLYEYYKYNALDTWGTGCCFLAMLSEAPKYAIDNYLLEFPLVFPCHLAEMTGIERDMDSLKKTREEQTSIVEECELELDKILGIPAYETFNSSSPKQMKQLLKLLGCGDLKDASKNNLERAKFRHPLNARILSLVSSARGAKKLLSTYLTKGKEFHRLDGTGNRILFALNPHGTDTSRLASRQHHFWCGLQIQNIPRGDKVKKTLVADPGFLLAEVDLSQAESRDTAYLSSDSTLIDNVENSPDFHCANAAAFFGIPFDKLYDVKTHTKLNIPIRTIAKNVNHGANYNMGPRVLIETMGEKNIIKAKTLIGLPITWSLERTAIHLLDSFHKTYPKIKGVFYTGIVNEVLRTNMISSTAVHYCSSKEMYPRKIKKAETWSRFCFGDPSKSKSILNSYIAHSPQSLNAQTLNKAFLKVFYKIAMNPEHRDNFKLVAQIHDSILFQYREGHEYLCEMVKKEMEIPITLKNYADNIETFTVPAEIKTSPRAKHWNETELD